MVVDLHLLRLGSANFVGSPADSVYRPVTVPQGCSFTKVQHVIRARRQGSFGRIIRPQIKRKSLKASVPSGNLIGKVRAPLYLFN